MCPSTCWRFSVPTRTRYSPSPPASLRAPGGLAVEIAHVGHQLAPLAGQQVDDVHALGRAFQQGRHGREEVHVGVGGDPALLAPGQDLLDLDHDLLRLGVTSTTWRTGRISKPLETSM